MPRSQRLQVKRILLGSTTDMQIIDESLIYSLLVKDITTL